MKAKRLFFLALVTLTVAAMPLLSAFSAEEQDTLMSESKPNAAVTVTDAKMTVNGKPATAAQKAVAKKMTKQGVRMARKGVQMAVTAVTDPDKAERLGDELERLGDEMECLGDSLEALAEDTTFFYEGEDSDAVEADDEDWDYFMKWKEKLEPDTWWGKLLGGGLGLLGGFLGILVAIFVVVLLFLLFTSPIWVLALIIWLIVKGSSSTSHAANQQAPVTTQSVGDVPPAQLHPSGHQEMWQSGVMWSCVGVGLIFVFLGIGLDAFWGIGALVACIGVAKLVIATTTKDSDRKDS